MSKWKAEKFSNNQKNCKWKETVQNLVPTLSGVEILNHNFADEHKY